MAAQVTAATAIVSLVLFMAASLLSMHVHVTPDGRMVVHSHAIPHSKAPHGHSHDSLEYALIGAQSHALDSGSPPKAPSLSFIPTFMGQPLADQRLHNLVSSWFDHQDRSPPRFAC